MTLEPKRLCKREPGGVPGARPAAGGAGGWDADLPSEGWVDVGVNPGSRPRGRGLGSLPLGS